MAHLVATLTDPLVTSAARSAVVRESRPLPLASKQVRVNRSTPPSEHGTSSGWGRKADSDWMTSFSALGMMMFAQFLVWFLNWSCYANDCSVIRSGEVMLESLKSHSMQPHGHFPLNAIMDHFATVPALVTGQAVAVWTLWLVAQFLLYSYMPGPLDQGQPTPAGYTLKYCVNGWNVWWFCHVSLFALCYFFAGFQVLTIVPDNWMGLFWIANTAGWALTIFAYIKAHVAPTHANDLKWSGSFWYDLFMGVEHNPRLSSHPYSFDFKIFFNGRPGIVAWSIINACFAASQYYRFGFVTNSMIIVNLLQSVYILDFFWNEGWYLRTIDICHEHFGFYLAWGDLVFLPFLYTLQGLFLSTHPVQLSPLACVAVLTLGLGGYALFRAVNAAKDRFRKEMKRLDAVAAAEAVASGKAVASADNKSETLRQRNVVVNHDSKESAVEDDSEHNKEDPTPMHQGRTVTYRGQTCSEIDYKTWGQPTRYLAARYHTGHGNEVRHSYLLVSGFWGMSRHMNYLGDLMLSLSFCLATGMSYILPYFYICFMTILLLHRVARDDEKCSQKYGKTWKKYGSIVKYKVLPYVY